MKKYAGISDWYPRFYNYGTKLMKKKIILCMSAVLLVLGTVLIKTHKAEKSFEHLYVNEVVTSNGSYPDEEGEYPDWIELYYEGEEKIDLSGYYLSDNKQDVKRWKFPAIELKSGEYLILFASGKDKVTDSGEIHTNFKLDCMGETLYLSDTEGKNIAVLEVPEMTHDKSYGAFEESYVVFQNGSPKEENLQKQAEKVKETKEINYSIPAGVYAEEIYLELSTKEKEAEIYYTLDGSVPTESSLKYDGEYLVVGDRSLEENKYTSVWSSPYDWEGAGNFSYNPNPQYKATVVKTRLYFPKENLWSDDIWTNTYLIGADYSLPIVSLSIEEELLFDENSGICVPGDAYVHYMATTEEINPEPRKRTGNYNSDRKVFGFLEYFTESGSKVMENQVTMRICGNISRGSGMKSFAVYAWGDEKSGAFSYPIFGDECRDKDGNVIDSFTSVRLRNFGNDWRRSKIRDTLGQSLVKEMDLGNQAYQPAIVLINGEYYGVCEIRENRDEKYFEKHFAIPEDNFQEIKIADLGTAPLTEDEEEFLELISYVNSHDLSVKENYRYVEEKLNVERFLDYVLVQLYLQNIDWMHNNCNFFKSKQIKDGSEYEDGRWHVLLYDVDYSINYENVDNYTTFYESGCYSAQLVNALLANEDCKEYYIQRFEELLEDTFEPSKGLFLQEQLENELAPEIQEDLGRWDVYQDVVVIKEINIHYWYEKMGDLKRFFVDRPEYAREYFYNSLK